MNRGSESGNVIFYIFLGIVLFGALSYAVAQSGRSSTGGVANDQNSLLASELIGFSDTMANAVGTLRLRGVTLPQLRFANASLSSSDYGAPDPANAENEVFDPAGGGAVYTAPPSEAVTAASTWMFLSGTELKGAGTTCGTSSCTDIMMVAPNITAAVCTAVNNYAELGLKDAAPPTTSGFDLTDKFKGSMAYGGTIGDEAYAKTFGCLQDSGVYYFYRVLWTQ